MTRISETPEYDRALTRAQAARFDDYLNRIAVAAQTRANELRLTDAEISARAKSLSRTTVARLLGPLPKPVDVNPSLEVLTALCDALDIDLVDLVRPTKTHAGARKRGPKIADKKSGRNGRR